LAADDSTQAASAASRVQRGWLRRCPAREHSREEQQEEEGKLVKKKKYRVFLQI
jgi:hypothetical protein